MSRSQLTYLYMCSYDLRICLYLAELGLAVCYEYYLINEFQSVKHLVKAAYLCVSVMYMCALYV